MKKITFLCSFFLFAAWQSHSQCFDSVITPALSNCCSQIIRGEVVSSMATVRTLDYNGAISGSNAAALDNEDFTVNYDLILVSPELNTLLIGAYHLKFFADGYNQKHRKTPTFRRHVGENYNNGN